MAGIQFTRAFRSSSGSWLDKLMDRHRHSPEEFACGVRVVEGAVAGERATWRYRTSSADPLIVDGWVQLNHGPDIPLTLRVDAEPVDAGRLPRPGHVALAAIERASGARVQLSVEVSEVARFGIHLR